MILLDTPVLAYAVGDSHPLREPSRRVVEAIRAGLIQATTTIGVIQEFAQVRARRRPRADAAVLARDFATLLSPLVPVQEGDLDLGLRLFEQHTELGTFDAVLAAVALNNDAEALVSSDRGFRGLRRLRHIDLARPEIDELLSR